MIKRKKIVNDPVHGFISIPDGLISEIVGNRFFQRLRDIKQLGMTSMVYPGASHSRLSHALGAMHLMYEALQTLISKGVDVSEEEVEASMAAILLHDVGHGPFSHALEGTIISGVSHEEISLAMMEMINSSMSGRLNMAISIFRGDYSKRFLHQLVSSQLDVDRLDYLRRDSFFSGVAEGMIGLERIIKMMTVLDNDLVIESKGIYSIEKFLISRRLMYWQVYLHKTVIAAETVLINILRRARELVRGGFKLDASPTLLFFLANDIDLVSIKEESTLVRFSLLDDSDIMSAIKIWQFCGDVVLERLCKSIVTRDLPKITLSNEPVPCELIDKEVERIKGLYGVSDGCASYFVCSGEVQNKGYDSSNELIKILSKDGEISNIYDVSDMLSAKAFSQITKKYFLCTAKN